MKRERIIYFDYLRVIAIIAVVVLHATAQSWDEFNGRSFEWNVFNLYNSISRWGVPVFVMISGALFLSRDIEIKNLYCKNILRMVIAFCVWSVFYAVVLPLVEASYVDNGSISYKSIISNIIGGCFHMWFIPMIIGMYMCVPIMKQIVTSRSITKYFMLLSLVFSYIIPQFVNMSNDFVGGLFADGVNRINDVISDMNMNMVLGYSLYFILGYYLNNVELTLKQRRAVYMLGLAGFLSTVLLNAIIAWKTNVPCDTYYGYFSLNVLLETIAVFTWIKYRKCSNDQFNLVISILSKYSFGAYLIHIFVLKILKAFGIHTMMCSPVISVPAISVIVVIISFIFSMILNKIPKLSKWIV